MQPPAYVRVCSMQKLSLFLRLGDDYVIPTIAVENHRLRFQPLYVRQKARLKKSLHHINRYVKHSPCSKRGLADCFSFIHIAKYGNINFLWLKIGNGWTSNSSARGRSLDGQQPVPCTSLKVFCFGTQPQTSENGQHCHFHYELWANNSTASRWSVDGQQRGPCTSLKFCMQLDCHHAITPST
jgi:hypothetical protein